MSYLAYCIVRTEVTILDHGCGKFSGLALILIAFISLESQSNARKIRVLYLSTNGFEAQGH